MVRVVRGVGWTLIVAGSVVLLYVVYLLWFTGLETSTQQRSLGDGFEAVVAEAQERPEPSVDEDEPPVEVGEAYAAIWFERDGRNVVTDDVTYVVEGTSVADLKRGPGHYVDSVAPGEDGNFAIAGHRTTYGAPFGEVGELREGDTIHVVDRSGTEWVYAYHETRIVSPSDVWVVEEDPLDGVDGPLITLTTCHPKFSAAQRMIVWGTLIGPAAA